MYIFVVCLARTKNVPWHILAPCGGRLRHLQYTPQLRILPEAFCIIGNAISYYTKKYHRTNSCDGTFIQNSYASLYSSVVSSFSSNRSSSEKSVSRISKSSSSSNPSSKNRSSSIDNSLFSLISRYFLIPVPAGISLPMITFSFRPTSGSIFPLIAASVRTFVVSWERSG